MTVTLEQIKSKLDEPRLQILNEFVEVLKMDLGTGVSDIESMIKDVIICLVESGSENLTEAT